MASAAENNSSRPVVPISDNFVTWGSCQFSATTFLAVNLPGRTRDGASDIENGARKVVFGMLCNAGLVVAATVEGLARLVFAAGVYIYQAIKYKEGEAPTYPADVTLTGALFSFNNSAKCAMAVYQNIVNWNGQVPAYNDLCQNLLIDEKDIGRMFFDEGAIEAPAGQASGEQQVQNQQQSGERPKAEAPKAEDNKPNAPEQPKSEAPKNESSNAA